MLRLRGNGHLGGSAFAARSLNATRLDGRLLSSHRAPGTSPLPSQRALQLCAEYCCASSAESALRRSSEKRGSPHDARLHRYAGGFDPKIGWVTFGSGALRAEN